VSQLIYFLASIIETALRLFPFPTRTGLIRIGNPDRTSPVLLTCNYHLTVLRVKRELKGMNAYLLVANSRGINVWCSATGGLFTNHDVISVLKTSGIEKLVDHRSVILPQLAATGIELRTILKKTGWRATFGPVYIKDIRAFLSGGEKSRRMREVQFDSRQRLEMAAAWAFPMSVVSVPIMLPLWPHLLLPLILLIWGLSLLIFMLFPLYSRWLSSKGRRIGFILFDFRAGGYPLILWGLFLAGLAAYFLLSGQSDWGLFLGLGISSFFILLLLSMDLMGSTPIYKSSLHEDRLFSIALNLHKCRGAGFCQDVCPRDCFQVVKSRHTAKIPRAQLCVQCGACIVQCPFDALSFRSPDGKVIHPETIRKYKLNLMGKRASGSG
jgi:NAD-dependent dihydropyrimidine dehydrogenase PreA subunit